jgi:hypothetical protein
MDVSSCDYQTRWIASCDDIDEIEQPSPFHQKTMFTGLFNRTNEFKMVILPEGQKKNGTYFMQGVPRSLTEIYYPQDRGTH